MTVKVSPQSVRHLWDYYSLELKLPRIAGGIPVDPRLIAAWHQSRWAATHLRPEDPQTVEEATQRTLALLGDVKPEECGWTTFARTTMEVTEDVNGQAVTRAKRFLALESRQIIACLKESANILAPITIVKVPKLSQVKPTTTFLRARLVERVFIREHLLPFWPLKEEADEVLERPIHVLTPKGPRSSIKRTDILTDVRLECTLKVLADGMFTEPVLRAILDHACENGLGADRSQGFGKFDYILTPTPVS